jgi:hypothetical protein
MSGRWPNFLIVGAARSGTTALFSFLTQHPEIFTPALKEPHYFAFPGRVLDFKGPGDAETINRRAVTSEAAYKALFAGVTTEKAVGEASVSSLYYEEAPRNIARVVPEARVVVLLRDPVERAFSNFQYMQATAREPLDSFEAALDDEEERIRKGWHHIWHYRNLGFYHRQLSRFYAELAAERIHVILYEDFRANPEAVVEGVLRFLGVDPTIRLKADREVNISGRPRSKALARFLVRSTPLKRILLAAVPTRARTWLVTGLRKRLLSRERISPRDAERLREIYRDDIESLQGLIGRDVSAWTGSSPAGVAPSGRQSEPGDTIR